MPRKPSAFLPHTRLGNLTIIARVGARVVYRCACGTTDNCTTMALYNGKRDCGPRCRLHPKTSLSREEAKTKAEDLTLRAIWSDMMASTRDIAHPDYATTGFIGVLVDPLWHNYDTFLADMGSRPRPNSVLRRHDTLSHFTLENCYWGSPGGRRKPDPESSTEALLHRATTNDINALGDTRSEPEIKVPDPTTDIIYASYLSAVDRATNPDHKFHIPEGIHTPWLAPFPDGYTTFCADLGPRPPGTILGRQDRTKPLEPGNCFWQSEAEAAEIASTERHARRLAARAAREAADQEGR